jgi:nicotinamidase-related amidase
LPVPEFYDPAHASQWSYSPDQEALMERAAEWRIHHRLATSSNDAANVHLVLVDPQKDFCFPEGTLFVGGRSGRGAIEDNDRIARFIYRNLGVLTEITCTLDTHYPNQIFSPSFWLDESGTPPPAHTEVTVADLRSGRFRPNPALAKWVAGGDEEWLRRQVEYYCEELERRGQFTLYLWPPHCIAGSEGHAIAGVIHEARLFHSYARLSPGRVAVKGEHPLTEFYSAIRPEVMTTFEGEPLAEPNTTFLEALASADAVILAGQAASHCVRATAEDLMAHLDPSELGKIYLLTDCMTSIAVPDPDRPGEFLFDFTPRAEATFARAAEAGMHLVESTTPIAEWPDFPG